jgi:hypothetical protein
METHTFEIERSDFDKLMNHFTGFPGMEADISLRIARLNADGHRVIVIEKDTGEVLHEFLPKFQSNESSEAPTSVPPIPARE